MSTTDAKAGPISIQRASFLARCNAVGGIYIVLAGGYGILEGYGTSSTTATIATVVALLTGCFMLVNAAKIYRKPESIDQGTEPTPRRWFILAGLVGGWLLLSLIIVVFTT